nr:MAG TPA: hypothetical protein [Caudoviricetes sp.]
MTNTNQGDLSSPSQNTNTLDKRALTTLTKPCIVPNQAMNVNHCSHNETTWQTKNVYQHITKNKPNHYLHNHKQT